MKIEVSENFCSKIIGISGTERRTEGRHFIETYGSTGTVAIAYREVCMKHETQLSLTKRATHFVQCEMAWLTP